MKSIKRKLKRGFTLVELVVTIAIIAILSGASVATYFGITENARRTNAENTATQIASVLRVEATAGDGSLSIGGEEGAHYLAVTPDIQSDNDIDIVIAALTAQGITLATNETLVEIADAAANSTTNSQVNYLHYTYGTNYNWYINCTNNFSISTAAPGTN